jgi:hypothetical protein
VIRNQKKPGAYFNPCVITRGGAFRKGKLRDKDTITGIIDPCFSAIARKTAPLKTLG